MAFPYNSDLDAFSLYHIVQESAHPNRHPSSSSTPVGPALPALGHAVSGSLGTAIAKLIVYPLDLVITRLQVQAQFRDPNAPPSDSDCDGLVDTAVKIYENEGDIRSFYSGVTTDVAKSVADSFLFFLGYNYIRQRRLKSAGGGSLGALDEIAVGMLAGALSKLATTPVQNVVTRQQTASLRKINGEMSLRQIAEGIREEKGVLGFWSGYSASLVLTLNPAITFLLHKILLQTLVPRSRQSDPGARLTFLIAAISKSVASSITYPFSLAKTRAQVSAQPPSAPCGQTSELAEPSKEDQDIIRQGEKAVAAKVRKARQRTVFSTILRIAQTEGWMALYQGLGAEVLKGFFSHGLTMLMKERIHGLVISLYYLVLKAAKRYPSSEEIRAMASERANGVYEGGKEQVSGVYASGKVQVNGALEKGREVVGNASQYAGNAVASGRTQAGELYEKGMEVVQSGVDGAKGMMGTGTVEKSADKVAEGSREGLDRMVNTGKEENK